MFLKKGEMEESQVIEAQKNKGQTLIDLFVDFLFSKDNRKYVLLLFLIGFVIRLIVSLRIPFGADEMQYAAHSLGFIDSGKLQIHDQDAIWFFLTDLFMKILGVNVLGLRFLSVIL